MRIGRTGKSDYPIAEDGYLSGLHFAVECDGTQCRIRDLGSSNGTFVNGSRVTEQVVQEGDSVVAGGSTFIIHVDLLPSITGVGLTRAATAPTPLAVATKVMSEPAPQPGGYSPAETALLQASLCSRRGSVRGGGRIPRLAHPGVSGRGGETYTPLESSKGAAAFVVALPADSRLVHVLIKDGWGRGWGFYGTSAAGLASPFANISPAS